MSYRVGIDIGSTATKVVVITAKTQPSLICTGIAEKFVIPTGWSSKNVAEDVQRRLERLGYNPEGKAVATGYGRQAVGYAQTTITEISCHAAGGTTLLYGLESAKIPSVCTGDYAISFEDYPACTIIDIGGQDTKVINTKASRATNFLMNDKCSAGTGKFLEVMASRLGVDIAELFDLAQAGDPLEISSMCTVFAESEIISHIGAGKAREDIAAGIVRSVSKKIIGLAWRHGIEGDVMLTGGLCEVPYFVTLLSQELGMPIYTSPDARYAGALGAALMSLKSQSRHKHRQNVAPPNISQNHA